jgi:Rrf2 family transcriptional regulator, nitric oxide-sensitive transcriptional repressor
MQLTLHADYALRVLLYLGLHPGRLVPTHEISRAYGISANHLVKVILHLNQRGLIQSRRGRAGGIRLAKSPSEINIGRVLRVMEPDWNLVECLEPRTNSCPIQPICGVVPLLEEALQAFLDVLDSHTLADILSSASPEQFEALFQAMAAQV